MHRVTNARDAIALLSSLTHEPPLSREHTCLSQFEAFSKQMCFDCRRSPTELYEVARAYVRTHLDELGLHDRYMQLLDARRLWGDPLTLWILAHTYDYTVVAVHEHHEEQRTTFRYSRPHDARRHEIRLRVTGDWVYDVLRSPPCLSPSDVEEAHYDPMKTTCIASLDSDVRIDRIVATHHPVLVLAPTYVPHLPHYDATPFSCVVVHTRKTQRAWPWFRVNNVWIFPATTERPFVMVVARNTSDPRSVLSVVEDEHIQTKPTVVLGPTKVVQGCLEHGFLVRSCHKSLVGFRNLRVATRMASDAHDDAWAVDVAPCMAVPS